MVKQQVGDMGQMEGAEDWEDFANGAEPTAYVLRISHSVIYFQSTVFSLQKQVHCSSAAVLPSHCEFREQAQAGATGK